MEIAPGLHAVQLRGARGYVICERDITLIDAGMSGSQRRLERYLAGIGRSLGEVRRIVCTHAHPDHIGGARELADASGAEVLLHPDDIAALGVTLREAWTARDRGMLLAYLTRGPHAATPLHDGEVISALGGLRVVHTPGHTPGSICLYAPRGGILFTGDMLQVIRGRVTFASRIFSADLARARASVARLAELDVSMIAFGHYPPWTDDPNAVLARLTLRAQRLATAT
ncbi:MAG TPA: MBL fold metallo-hydrolase [Candidatus Limnocylindria bacterium]|jgi:glyoxylase-like metal-dependent hydrolase (beta-lactamase superfamily II)|nr:MBL fold metallo-hydrolase [Candidatus Limnocylindria bacterium]